MKNILKYHYKRSLHFKKYFLLVIILISCEDFVEVDPPTDRLVDSSVFANDASAMSALIGVYSTMMERRGFASGFNSRSVTFLCGLSSDEFDNYNPSLDEFFNNSITPSNTFMSAGLWDNPYLIIYSVNAILEGIRSETSGVTKDLKRQLEGEAKFIRAFSYFYLVNLFGDVPLYITTDFQMNAQSERTPKEQVYEQIITDLKDAQTLLMDDYSASDGERSRPNKFAAMALLARVHLYLENWSDVEETASKVIDHSALYSVESDLDNVFLANSLETIWQLIPVEPGYNTNEGRYFILTSSPVASQRLTLSDQLLASFETGDNRRNLWVDSFTDETDVWHYPYKYKIAQGETLTEYSMVLRLAEQYLIRAEARAKQGNVAGAQSDINVIRNRAGLENTMAATQETLLDAVTQERKVELFAEWGHRWLDLKRTGFADQILDTIKMDWQPTDVLYPIPEQEIRNNPKITQNPGFEG